MMGIGRRPKHARATKRLSIAVVSLLALAGTSTFGVIAALAPAASATTTNWVGGGVSPGLVAVSCSSVDSCAAVGTLTNVGQNFTYGWNGVFWEPTGSAASPTWQPFAVSCVSGPFFCAAVGQGAEISTNAGGGFTNVPSPNTSGISAGVLDAVSCVSASFCMATGAYANGGPLIEQWNGSAWSVVPSPATNGTPDGNPGELQGVSCTSPSSCVAVGTAGDLHNQTLVEQWNGTSWSIVPSPNTSATVNNDLDAISCTSASACTAVGAASSSAIVAQTLIEQWNGATWSIVPSPNPVIGAGVSASNQLSGVSCPSASACTTVGQTTSTPNPSNGPSATQSLMEQWNGTAWSLEPTLSQSAGFSGVSCVTASACVAVGSTAGIAISDPTTFAQHGDDSGPVPNTGPVTVTGISPNSGPAAGGTPITITGTGFTGTEFVTFLNGSLATNVVVVNDSTITATAPSGPPNTGWYVFVTTPSGTSPPVALSQFSWAATAPPGPAPTITSLSPTSGPSTGGTSVAVKGTGFNGATQVRFGTVPASSFSVSSSTRITAVAPAEAAGAYDVTVTTANGTSSAVTADQLISIAPPPPPVVPTVTSVSPNWGPTTGGTAITITGKGFVAGASVVIGQGNGAGTGAMAATNVKVVSPTQITATTAGGAKAATWNLFVTTAGGTSAATVGDSFTYTAPSAPPSVSSVSPNSGPTTGGTSITITGKGFVAGATVVIGQGSGAGAGAISATNVKVVSPTQITATTAGGAKAATWNLFVTTSGGTSAANAGDSFTYH
jgi:large repetitive protein